MHPKTSVKHMIFATAINSNIKLIAGLVEYKKLAQKFFNRYKRLINTNYKINPDELVQCSNFKACIFLLYRSYYDVLLVLLYFKFIVIKIFIEQIDSIYL